ncbi:MAG TPA: phage holin family protein [Patescibacteria group bacterium]|nr:phage holin family protein [Patescibacteria group bacterium]
MKFIANWFLNAVALYLVSRILQGIHIHDFWSALIAAAVIGLVNALVKPVFLLLTLPITIITLGLFTFVINACMLLLASALTPGFKVDGFVTALIGSILLSIISTILHSLVRS